MPIYEYKCKKCGKEFEVFQGITDTPAKSCKFCRGTVEKLMSLSSFHLKGSGWYVTDYRGKKAPHSEKEKKESAPAETPKAETTTTKTSPDD
jgi:putative FmdB family regulatory protein